MWCILIRLYCRSYYIRKHGMYDKDLGVSLMTQKKMNIRNFCSIVLVVFVPLFGVHLYFCTDLGATSPTEHLTNRLTINPHNTYIARRKECCSYTTGSWGNGVSTCDNNHSGVSETFEQLPLIRIAYARTLS